jgi:site-specific DNA-adenine methylase
MVQSYEKPVMVYRGNKFKSLPHILPNLPYRKTWVEVFGGTCCVSLNRTTSKLNVINDKYSAITDFYRCIRDPEKLEKLIGLLAFDINSKESFLRDREYHASGENLEERAAMWYRLVMYSFNGKGTAWGRALPDNNGHVQKVIKKLPLFAGLHDKLQFYQIENDDWENILEGAKFRTISTKFSSGDFRILNFSISFFL